MKNEFKLSTLRQFGWENFSFTATVHSDNLTLTDEEIAKSIAKIDTAINKAFIACQEREISEMELLANASERRAVEIKKRDDALKAEMEVKKNATNTLKCAEKLSTEITEKK